MPAREQITLAILARDAESTIASTIDSARAYVDHVVVRDTGSTDATVEVAQECGARVLSGSWRHDFSRARNLEGYEIRIPEEGYRRPEAWEPR